MFSQAPLPVLDLGGHTIQNIARTSFDINKSFQINVMYRVKEKKYRINSATTSKNGEKIFFLASLVRIFFTSPASQTEINITIFDLSKCFISYFAYL